MGIAAGIGGRATEEITDRLLPGRMDRGNNRCNVIEIREMAVLFGVLVAKEPMSIAGGTTLSNGCNNDSRSDGQHEDMLAIPELDLQTIAWISADIPHRQQRIR
jgi:hypothetical protein